MNQLMRYASILVAVVVLAACGGSDKKISATITEKKTELEKKKNEQTKLAAEIKKLEEELAKLDTASAKNSNAKLVSVTTLSIGAFNHFIELQGKVTSNNIFLCISKVRSRASKSCLCKTR
jgi:membrane fusion protein (multidrug efflux system)